MTEPHKHNAACSRVLEGVKVWTCNLATREELHNGHKFDQEELHRMRGNLGLAMAALHTFLAQNNIYARDPKLTACRQLLTCVASDLGPTV